MANCASISGVQSTLAPTSTNTTGVPSIVGKMPSSAGRSTPGTTPCTILAVAMMAPVFPAAHILLAHQENFHAQSPGGSNRPFHFGYRGVVSAHCIQRNGQHVGAG